VHKKNFTRLCFGVLVLGAIVIGAVFSFPISSAKPSLSLGGPNMFTFIPPGGTWNNGIGVERLGTRHDGGHPQVFSLQINREDGSIDSVFSETDQRRMTRGNTNWLYQNGVNVRDYGFVILDDDESVSFELLNLSGYTNTDAAVWWSFRSATDATYSRFGIISQRDDNTANHFRNHGSQSNEYIRDWAEDNHGRIAFNTSHSFIGKFSEPGYYEFNFTITADGVGFYPVRTTVRFAFYIVCASEWEEAPFLQGDPIYVGARRYFYNFDGDEPFTLFNPERFAVSVRSTDHGGINPTRVTQGDLSRYNFQLLGNYRVESEKIFTFHGVDVDVLNYSGDFYTLGIFGWQSFFQEGSQQSWFGGRGEHGYGADVTARLPSGWDFGDLIGFEPVVTNSPPVLFRGGGGSLYNAQSVIYFNNGRTSTTRNVNHNQLLTERLVAPGDYKVVLYYTFPIVHNFSTPHEIFRQVFYFRITDLADVRISAGGEVFHFNQFQDADRVAYINGPFIVFMDNANPLDATSPYSIVPQIELQVFEFDRTTRRGSPRWFDIGDPMAGQAIVDEFGDGFYRFRVFYGAHHVARAEFSVIVDYSKIDSFDVEYIGLTELNFMNQPDNFVIFGGLEADNPYAGLQLEWREKESGASFTGAAIHFYSFNNLGALFEQDAGDHTESFLRSTYQMNHMRSQTSPPIEQCEYDLGRFFIDFNFRVSGLYIITVRDSAGNDSRFTIVIDNTSASFVQSIPSSLREAERGINMVDSAVSIGFGEYKVIGVPDFIIEGEDFASDPTDYEEVFGLEYALGFYVDYDDTQTLYEMLRSSGILQTAEIKDGTNNTIDGFAIPILQAEMSTQMWGNNFQTVFLAGSVSYPKHYTDPQLTDENYYVFRTLDYFGNQSYYYIIINRDPARGTILQNNDRFDDDPLPQNVSIVQSGGIVNQNFAVFSFFQEDRNSLGDGDFVVERVEMRFHPRTHQENVITTYRWSINENRRIDDGEEYDGSYEIMTETRPNPNYPFSFNPTIDGRVIYCYDYNENTFPVIDSGFRYLEINHNNTETQEGIYIITRFFDPDTVDQAYQIIRNHFFIVDRTAIIDFDFESQINIEFGEKTATIHDFERDRTVNHTMHPGRGNTVLMTNTSAQINLPNNRTKFGGKTLMELDFPECDIHNGDEFDFTSLNLNYALEKIIDGSFEGRAWTDSAITGAGMYRLDFSDGSGGLRWQQYGTGERISPPNRSQILFEIIGEGAQGEFRHNTRVITRGSTQASPDDAITFQYVVSDANGFFADISHATIRMGDSTSINVDNLPVGVVVEWESRGQILRRIDLHRIRPFGGVQNGDVFTITLYTNDGSALNHPTVFILAIDNTPPSENLRVIRGLCNLWTTSWEFSNPDNFIYSIPNWFYFSNFSCVRESFRIAYFEVNETGSNLLGTRSGVIPYNVSFSSVVDMQPGQNRFFRIVEQDEAENTTVYYVNLRMDFDDAVTTTGLNQSSNLFEENSLGLIFGSNVSVTNAATFWRNNSYFELRYETSPNNYQIFRRFGTGASRGTVLAMETINNPRDADLVLFLNTWLDHSRARTNRNGEFVMYFNNGFGEQKIHLLQIPQGQFAVLPALEVIEMSNGVDVQLRITNWNSLPWMFREFQLLRLYFGDIGTSLQDFGPMGEFRNFLNRADDELLFVVTDLFGRTVRAEHNGRYGNRWDLRYSGQTQVHNGLRHTGDSRGVEIIYTYRVHELEIWRDNVLISHTSVPVEGEQFLRRIILTPPTDAEVANIKVTIRSIATRSNPGIRMSGNLVHSEEFVFYRNLPEIIFSNLNGNTIEVEADANEYVEVSGIVQAHFSIGSTFSTVISYSRRVPNPRFNPAWDDDEWNPRFITTHHAPRVGSTRFRLDRVAFYAVTVGNAVGAAKTYMINVVDVDNIVYRVWFEGDALEASPVLFSYTFEDVTRQIPHYFVRGLPNDVPNLINIDPSSNYPRRVIGRNGNEYWQRLGPPQHTVITYIYALQSKITGDESSPDPETLIFFAVTGIAEAPCSENLSQFSGITNTNINVNPAHPVGNTQARSALYQLFRSEDIPNTGLHVTLLYGGTGHRSYSFAPGNVYVVDYYYNGNFAGTFGVGETLVIHEKDYGEFQFFIRDWAGHRRVFIQGANVSGWEQGTADFFTIINLARPPIFINGGEIIDGMVYNDELVLTQRVLPYTPQNISFMYVSLVEINGQEYFSATEQHGVREWRFTTPGTYRFRIEFAYNNIVTIYHEFSVQIVPRWTGVDYVRMSLPSNMDLESVRLDGIDITNTFGQNPRELNLIRNGLHHVSLTIAADNIQDARTVSFVALIEGFPALRNIIDINVGFGERTRRDVNISVDSWRLWDLLLRDATVTVSRNGQVLPGWTIGIDAFSFERVSDVFTHEGYYLIVVTTSCGVTIFSEGFEIYEGMSAMGWFLIIAGVLVILVGVFVFFRMRRGMRVR